MAKARPLKKRNPQDLTLRNLRALKRRLAVLEFRVDQHAEVLKALSSAPRRR